MQIKINKNKSQISSVWDLWLTLTSVQETIRPSDDTEQKLWLLSMSSFCQRTCVKKKFVEKHRLYVLDRVKSKE